MTRARTPARTPARAWASVVLAVGVSASATLTVDASAAGPSASSASSSAASASRTAVQRTITDPRIDESSGLTRSARFAKVIYTHNDSGDSARVFAIGPKGATRSVLTLPGATARDWEDIATGPKQTLWVGDIGDNARARKHVTVYRFKEPTALGSRSVKWLPYYFTFPDGAHDAEALLVRPRTGRVFIATKGQSGGQLYRAPKKLTSGKVHRLVRTGYAVPPMVTGGDFFPDGRMVLRNYDDAYVYRRPGAKPRVISLPAQLQGESVMFSRSGKSLLIGSEGSPSTVIYVAL